MVEYIVVCPLYVCGGIDFASLYDFSIEFQVPTMWYFFILLTVPVANIIKRLVD